MLWGAVKHSFFSSTEPGRQLTGLFIVRYLIRRLVFLFRSVPLASGEVKSSVKIEASAAHLTRQFCVGVGSVIIEKITPQMSLVGSRWKKQSSQHQWLHSDLGPCLALSPRRYLRTEIGFGCGQAEGETLKGNSYVESISSAIYTSDFLEYLDNPSLWATFLCVST